MNHPYEFEDIKDYNNSHMSEADRQVFEETLATNEFLQKELEAVKAQEDIMLYLRKKALTEEIEKWDRKEEDAEERTTAKDGKATPFKNRPLLAVVAFLILSIAAYSIFKYGNHKTEETEPQIEQPTNTDDKPLEDQTSPVDPKQQKRPIAKEEDKKTEPKPATPNRPSLKEVILKNKQYADAGIERIANGFNSSEKRAATSKDTSHYQQALQFFQDSQYAQVIAVKGQEGAKLTFIQAVSSYRLKKYNEAASSFRSIPIDSDLGLDAQWGEVMSLMALLPDSCTELTGLLEKIKDSKFYQYHHYKEELDQLEKTTQLLNFCDN